MSELVLRTEAFDAKTRRKALRWLRERVGPSGLSFLNEVSYVGSGLIWLTWAVNPRSRRVAGFALWQPYYESEENGDWAHSLGTWVAPSYRRTGLARRLWLRAFRVVKVDGISVTTISASGARFIESMVNYLTRSGRGLDWDANALDAGSVKLPATRRPLGARSPLKPPDMSWLSVKVRRGSPTASLELAARVSSMLTPVQRTFFDAAAEVLVRGDRIQFRFADQAGGVCHTRVESLATTTERLR